jgi:hypothetical protein
MRRSSQRGFALILEIILIAVVLGAVGFAWIIFHKSSGARSGKLQTVNASNPSDNPYSREFSKGKCQGKGVVQFTHLPMNIGDIGPIYPYGGMTEAHVVPISHGYIYPVVQNSARDAYPVYAIADGYIVNIGHRSQFVGDGHAGRQSDEYQLTFEHSCTFYSYFDLLTSLTPELAAKVGKSNSFDNKYVRIPVKAGQLLGRVGGQSVDFGVWNFELPAAKFVNPQSYIGDEERFYLDDMFAHFTPALRTQLLSKDVRVAEPRSGKVNYDIDGKMVGNWFQEGTGGFAGPPEQQGKGGSRYWDGHLTIAYDNINPTQIRVSIGNWNGQAEQFGFVGNQPDPAKVSLASGMLKLELQKPGNAHEAGSGVTQVQGTVLLQMIEPHKLKLEEFPGKLRDEVAGFTPAARIYVR